MLKLLVNLVKVLLVAIVVDTFMIEDEVVAMLCGMGKGASVWFNKGTKTSSVVDVLDGIRPVAEVISVV